MSYERLELVNGITKWDADKVQHLEDAIIKNEESIEHNDIPRIFFNSTLQTTKDDKIVKFNYYSKTKHFEGYAKIKMQGNFSTTFPKKNQTIKLYMDKDCTAPLNIEFKNWGLIINMY